MFGALLNSASLMAAVLNRVARGKWKRGCHFICLMIILGYERISLQISIQREGSKVHYRLCSCQSVSCWRKITKSCVFQNNLLKCWVTTAQAIVHLPPVKIFPWILPLSNEGLGSGKLRSMPATKFEKVLATRKAKGQVTRLTTTTILAGTSCPSGMAKIAEG